MRFSPAFLSSLIVEPLRYLYANNAPEELVWTPDPKTTGIEIDTINNFHKIAIQQKPRIMVGRGQYDVNPVGLTDNLAQGKTFGETRGTKDVANMFLVRGVSQIQIEARNEGTCEKVVDLTQHFLTWTGPMIANLMGFKICFVPMSVSPCIPSREDAEKFTCTINIPWTREEHWRVTSGDQIALKNFLVTLVGE